MPKTTSKSAFASKVGSKGLEGFNNAKDTEYEGDGGGRLPAGVTGVARLVDCRFGVYKEGDNKGEFFFYAAGVVVAPKMHNGIPIVGSRTQIGPEPLCDTPGKSREGIDEHMAWMVNELKGLGADFTDVNFDDPAELEQGLIEVMKELVEEGPYFKFRTWASKPNEKYPNPRTNENWGGVIEGYDPDSASVGETSAVTDESGDGGSKGKLKTTKAEEPDDDDEKVDLDALLKKANKKDAAAQESLQKFALKIGLKKAQVEHDDLTWNGLVDLIKEKQGEGSDDNDTKDENDAAEYSKGDVVKFKVGKKMVEHEIIKISGDKADIKSLDDNKVQKGVDVSDLKPVE